MREVTLNAKGENKGHYAPGVIAGGLLFVSGQLSLDLDTRPPAEGGPAEHMKQALAKFDALDGYEALFITEDHTQHRSAGFAALETA